MVIKEEEMVRGVKYCLGTIVTMAEMIGKLTKGNDGFIEMEDGRVLRVSHYDDGQLNGFISYPVGNNGKSYRIVVEHERK